jgi:hypothetical protein
MSVIALNHEKWIGEFTYQNEDEDGIWDGDSVKWEMEIHLDQDSFTGFRVDEETEKLFEEPIPVTGFKDGDEINFVVKYPCNYDFDREGEPLLMPNEPHPGAKYHGYYDDKKMEYRGEWEVEFEALPIGILQEDYISGSIIGTWKMKRARVD